MASAPIIGSVLSDFSNTPSFPIKDGWSIYDSQGVCSAYTNFYNYPSTTRIWTFSGNSSTTTVAGKYQWSAQVGSYYDLDTYATDCLGNTGTGYEYISPSLYQQGAADYSAGWTSGSCKCWSGGSIMKSSTVGASANYSFYGPLVSLSQIRGPAEAKHRCTSTACSKRRSPSPPARQPTESSSGTAASSAAARTL